jgi:hypothetical protein
MYEEYKRCLRKYLIYDIDMYDNTRVRIFQDPVQLLFCWIDKSSSMFFSIYTYKDKYVIIQDDCYGLYDYLKEPDQDTFSEIIIYLFRHSIIYDNLNDIKKHINNNILLDEFNYFLNNIYKNNFKFDCLL